jgi:hypothetical protein
MAFAAPTVGWMSRVFTALTVLALAVRFAIPAGIMLEKPAEDGDMPTLVICTNAGLITVKADGFGPPGHSGKTDPAKHDSGKGGEPCVFAAVAAMVPPAAVFVTDLPVPVSPAAPWIAVTQRPGEGLAAPPPPATGPPAIV